MSNLNWFDGSLDYYQQGYVNLKVNLLCAGSFRKFNRSLLPLECQILYCGDVLSDVAGNWLQNDLSS
jgi:hypothetical protein